jgi:hypothetical protein
MSSRSIKAEIRVATLPIPSQGSSLACKHIFLHSLRCFLLDESPIQIPAAGDANGTATNGARSPYSSEKGSQKTSQGFANRASRRAKRTARRRRRDAWGEIFRFGFAFGGGGWP